MKRITLLYISFFTLIIILACSGSSPTTPVFEPESTLQEGVKAFPGATGFGTNTQGGRGGKVIYVTNLENSGQGSLRAALMDPEPRMVLFRVSGTITLGSDILITQPFLTVAGQSAPGEGVQIRGGHIKIATHDVIIRYLKVRSGDMGDKNMMADRDAITVNNGSRNHGEEAHHIVIDHSTLIWGPDIGGLSFLYGTYDATVSYSIIGEGLYHSWHPEGNNGPGGHSMAMNISELDTPGYPRRITVHHNLLTTSSDRNPRVMGGENIDIVNNVIYNWQKAPSQGNPRSLNLVKNFYIKGPMTIREAALAGWSPRANEDGSLRTGTVFEYGNIAEGFTNLRGNPQSVYTDQPFAPFSLFQEDSPQEAYASIVRDAGANVQVAGKNGHLRVLRDSVDRRIIHNLENRTGKFFNGTGKNRVENLDAITWPELARGVPAQDEDLDGMPDAWERKFFGTTERGSTIISWDDYDSDGYTDLEEYLNQTNPTVK